MKHIKTSKWIAFWVEANKCFSVHHLRVFYETKKKTGNQTICKPMDMRSLPFSKMFYLFAFANYRNELSLKQIHIVKW